LNSNGYNTEIIKYCASDFGVPQTRKRVILYAWKNKNFINPELKTNKKIKGALKDVFKNAIDLKNHNLEFIKKDSNDFKIAERILPGQKLCNVRGGDRSIHTWNIPEVFGLVNDQEKHYLHLLMKLRRQIRRRKIGDADPVEYKFLYDYFGEDTKIITESLLEKGYIKKINKKFIDICHTFNGKFKRLSIENLSPTVDTRFGSYKNFLHPYENRGLTVREAARIQGFTDSFVFLGPVNKQYQMVGNAVPPPLGDFIAKTIQKNIIPYL
jgi:DNA (cytosine-5)-methyltransferase 1